MIEFTLVFGTILAAASWLLVRAARAWRRRDASAGCSGCVMSAGACRRGARGAKAP